MRERHCGLSMPAREASRRPISGLPGVCWKTPSPQRSLGERVSLPSRLEAGCLPTITRFRIAAETLVVT